MSTPIEIRAYVVGFGDCILLRLPEGKNRRHVLVDFGRSPNDPSSLERFPAIAEDIEKECNGHLDLLVMTHEHLDHLEGFYRERKVFNRMQVDQVWMGLPSHPKYYDMYKKARPQKKLREAVARFTRSAERHGLALHPAFRELLENNLANKDRIDYLRKLGKKKVAYLARGAKGRAATRWSEKIDVSVLAPEADVSVYYSSHPGTHALSASFAATYGVAVAPERKSEPWEFKDVPRADGDHVGFSESDFARLRRSILEDGVAAARFIDRAQNNTSLCLLITVDGKRLLLPGDAELESWEHMANHFRGQLGPVDFLKVAHHGSRNGTLPQLLDELLPVKRAAKAKALVSTKHDVYGTKNPVPDQGLLKELGKRCGELITTDGAKGTHVDLEV